MSIITLGCRGGKLLKSSREVGTNRCTFEIVVESDPHCDIQCALSTAIIDTVIFPEMLKGIGLSRQERDTIEILVEAALFIINSISI